MKVREREFILPIGYEDANGNIHRNGMMRMTTALDEIEVQNDDRNSRNKRFRDCLILSRVITSLGDFQSVSLDMFEDFFEVDFIFLQMFYNKINRDNDDSLLIRCPSCSQINSIPLSFLFKDMYKYFEKKSGEKKVDSMVNEVKTS